MKMGILKNKKSQEAGATPVVWQMVGWILAFALLIFALLWYSGLGEKIMSLIKSF